MNVSLLFSNFSSGEISPLVTARVDAAVYNLGARALENFLVLPAGGVRKRPGTWFDGYTANNGKARLIEFPLSGGSYLICEFTAGLVRFRDDHFQLLPATVATDYTEPELDGIKYAVNRDTLWLAHRNHPVRKLSWGTPPVMANAAFTGNGITFSAPGDYPGCIAFDSGRLWLAATRNNPDAIWASMAPDSAGGQDRHENFTFDTEGTPYAGNAIYLEENDMYGSKIAWIAGNRRILAATDRATWMDTGDIPSPATFDMNIVEYTGASGVQGKGSKGVLVYAGRDGKSLRALVFQSSTEGNSGYADINISETAAHLFVSGIKEIAVMDYPLSMVWVVTGDGSLVSCALDFRQGLAAFSRHPREGKVESIAIGPGSTDVLWLVVRHGDKRFVEHLVIDDVPGAGYLQSHYVDAGVHFTSANPEGDTEITGLGHLALKEVSVFADGSIMPNKKVGVDGTLTLPFRTRDAHVGLPCVSVLVPVTPLIPANGTSLGKKRRIEMAMLRLYESFGGKIGTAMDRLETIGYLRYGKYIWSLPGEQGGTGVGEAPRPFTGDISLTVSGNIDPDGTLIVMHDSPTPFTVLALVERVAIMEA
jgi:hypothetical protein